MKNSSGRVRIAKKKFGSGSGYSSNPGHNVSQSVTADFGFWGDQKDQSEEARHCKAAEARCLMLTSNSLPVLLETTFPASTSIVVASVQKVVQPALLYASHGREKTCCDGQWMPWMLYCVHKQVEGLSDRTYESFSDVGEIRVWFASKILTPCRMH